MGKTICRELIGEDGADTLGRWMAHHLADLIKRVEALKATKERTLLEKETVDMILKIWDHRARSNRNFFPLKKLGDALNVFYSLRPASKLWESRSTQSPRMSFVSDLYVLNRRAIIFFFLSELHHSKKGVPSNISEIAIRMSGKTEKEIYKIVNEWKAEFSQGEPSENSEHSDESLIKYAEEIKEQIGSIVDRLKASL